MSKRCLEEKKKLIKDEQVGTEVIRKASWRR